MQLQGHCNHKNDGWLTIGQLEAATVNRHLLTGA
jgi:hypothetical protein